MQSSSMSQILLVVTAFLFVASTTTAFVPVHRRGGSLLSSTCQTRSPHLTADRRISVLPSSSSSSTATESTGLIKTITRPGSNKAVKLGDIATVKYACYLPDNEKAAPFAKAEKQKMVVGDGTMVKGWEQALRTMTVGERAIVRIVDPSLGYGLTGVPPLIPPNAMLEFDIEILDTQLPTENIDFDSIATADSTPRTAAEIEAAYEKRMAIKALDGPEREGLEGFLDKAKNFYFFGFFEGETGEQAPWFLRPSITFPIAFAIVGAAFYVSIVSGAISERGAAVKDELDDVIFNTILLQSFVGLDM